MPKGTLANLFSSGLAAVTGLARALAETAKMAVARANAVRKYMSASER